MSAKQLITFPNINNDLLILHPSLSLSPVAPVEPDLSEPAKSTKFIILNFSLFFFATIVICLNSIVTIVCALELVAFIKVDPIVLLLYPSSIFLDICSYDVTGYLDKPSTNIPNTLLSLILSPCGGLLSGLINKSCTFSLYISNIET